MLQCDNIQAYDIVAKDALKNLSCEIFSDEIKGQIQLIYRLFKVFLRLERN